MTDIKFLDLRKQYLSMKGEIDDAIASVLNESAFVGGRFVRDFEDQFASYQHAKYCIGVGNGTDALEIAIEALELPSNSEIIVPANSFIASSEAITRSGHKVVFCDVNADDYTIDVEDVAKRITSQTAAILGVHLYGHPCDMGALIKVASQHGIKVIEDCAQAHGAAYHGRRVGAIGDIGAFSFYPGKTLGAYGDAGCIVTNDSDLADRCRMIANHGRIDKYDHVFEGRNSRLDGIQAAVLSAKLNYLDEWISVRVSVAEMYMEGLRDIPGLKLPTLRAWATHTYHLFVVQQDNRDELLRYLKKHEIECSVHYPRALPDLQAYARYSKNYIDTPVSKRLADRIFSLPIGEHLDPPQVTRVIDACARSSSSL